MAGQNICIYPLKKGILIMYLYLHFIIKPRQRLLYLLSVRVGQLVGWWVGWWSSI